MNAFVCAMSFFDTFVTPSPVDVFSFSFYFMRIFWLAAAFLRISPMIMEVEIVAVASTRKYSDGVGEISSPCFESNEVSTRMCVDNRESS